MRTRRGPLDVLASGVDQAMQVFALTRSKRSRQRSTAESLGPEARVEVLSTLAARYGAFVAKPDAFFPDPAAAEPNLRFVRPYARGRVVDLVWPSAYEPYASELRDAYHGWESNRRAHARLFTHGRPRPTVVLIHGYLGGNHGFEERVWPVRWLFDKGLDVVLFVLPLHGERRASGRPKFPSSDPRITIEGFRQFVGDFRALHAYLRAREVPAVGAMGMSLGGYSAALLSTLVDDLAFTIPMIPLASIADFARDGDRFVGTASQQRRQHELLEETLSVVSPLSRPCLVPRTGRLVLAARGDRVTPMTHAQRLAHHLDAPLEVFTGGHLLQLGRGRAFHAVGRLLAGLGWFEA